MNKISYLLLSSLYIVFVSAKSDSDDKPIAVSATHFPEAQCKFTVHNKTADGPVIEGTNLNQELYYKISCKQDKGYCLYVSNCTVSTNDDQSDGYEIIDHNGCTNEPSLFEHVEYLDDFTAGIYNPLPIRFRKPGAAVHFHCSTTLKPRDSTNHCERPACTKNHYSADANFHGH
ncbi:ZP domain-containing protein [Aphelenchoides besseyi]|nr:ZP domain-containing protein [Aphelenchoides besseyi]KAI6222503.1 ZP domain-containing protein [Aphelenchoides besseyi]